MASRLQTQLESGGTWAPAIPGILLVVVPSKYRQMCALRHGPSTSDPEMGVMGTDS